MSARRRWRRRLAAGLAVLLLAPPLVALASAFALRFVHPPVTALQAIRLVEGHGFTREIVPLAAMSPHLPRAVIAAEDNLFCRHRGVDWAALRTEIERLRRGERARGASTLTMQLTRNLYLWPARSPVRKTLELALAPLVDLTLSKPRQLALYLNHVEFAAGVYGAEAAARHWFTTSAGALDREQAATLAALLPGPLLFSPESPRVQRQRARIRRRVDQLGPLLDCAPAP